MHCDAQPAPLRVWSVPAGHAYVETAIGPPGEVGDGLWVRPDPPAADGATNRSWPSPAFDPGLVRDHLREVDVLHVHFGFEGAADGHLERVVAAVREAGVALVVTVHDLANPHLEDQSAFLARLGVLVEAADAVITLTGQAAAQIRARWGREALVLPHPHVAPLALVGGARPPRSRAPRVTLPLKSLRASTLRTQQLAQVAEAVFKAGARLHADLHREALDADFPRYDPAVPALVARWRKLGGEVDVHERVDDEEFLTRLAATDVVLLPYRHGTHSGLLEACHDLGTAVIAPDVGCYTGQHPFPTYSPDDIPGTLPGALGQVLREPVVAADREERAAEAAWVRAEHRRVYAEVVAARGHREIGGDENQRAKEKA